MDENRKNPFPWIVIAGGLLLSFSALAYALINRPSAAVATQTPGSLEQVQRVSLEDAKAAYDDRSAVFLDVRDRSSYAAEHIPGAVLMPLSELPNRSGELNPKSWIIPYCT